MRLHRPDMLDHENIFSALSFASSRATTPTFPAIRSIPT